MSDNRYLHLVRQDCPLPRGSHVVAYCRDSSGEGQERSMQQQVEVVQEYAAYHGLILERVYIDDTRQASGTEKRTQFQEMQLDRHNRFKQIHDRHKRQKKARAAKQKGDKTDPAHEPRRLASRHLLSGLVYCRRTIFSTAVQSPRGG